MTCPICKKPSLRDGNAAWPFCSDRCRMIDLGKWLDEDYRVPGEADQDGAETDTPAPAPTDKRTS
jgi:uncharacterized protein